MKIDSLQGSKEASSEARVLDLRADAGFGDALVDAVQRVADQQSDAASAAKEFVSDPGAKIHETMLRVQKADISLRAFVTMRNKVLDAYREVMRMGQ